VTPVVVNGNINLESDEEEETDQEEEEISAEDREAYQKIDVIWKEFDTN
jgi:hypothetical protein